MSYVNVLEVFSVTYGKKGLRSLGGTCISGHGKVTGQIQIEVRGNKKY